MLLLAEPVQLRNSSRFPKARAFPCLQVKTTKSPLIVPVDPADGVDWSKVRPTVLQVRRGAELIDVAVRGITVEGLRVRLASRSL